MIGDSGLFTDIVAVPMQGARALGAEELMASEYKKDTGRYAKAEGP